MIKIFTCFHNKQHKTYLQFSYGNLCDNKMYVIQIPAISTFINGKHYQNPKNNLLKCIKTNCRNKFA